MYRAQINKKGRKWYQVLVTGKKNTYEAKVLINEISQNWQAGDIVEFDADFVDKSNGYGKKYEFTPITMEMAAIKIQAIHAQEGEKWFGYIVSAFKKDGYIYSKAVTKLKELGLYEKYQDQIKEMATIDKQNRRDAEEKRWLGYVLDTLKKEGYIYKNGITKLKELGVYEKYQEQIEELSVEMEKLQIARRYGVNEDEAEKVSNFGVGYKCRKGDIILNNERVYRILACVYNDSDGWSFGVMSEEWYSITALDITYTAEGQDRLDKDAREKAIKAAQKERDTQIKKCVDEIAEYVRENGTRPDDAGNVEGYDIIDTFNIYGGGIQITLCDNVVWYIRNNGFDGGDWSLNNVRTGGAGAIGWCVEQDDVLKVLLQRLETAQRGGYNAN